VCLELTARKKYEPLVHETVKYCRVLGVAECSEKLSNVWRMAKVI
jgi:hypothetical protein